MPAKLKLILSMCIFGTIGVFRRWIPLPSGLVALARGAIGALFLYTMLRLCGGRLDRSAIRKSFPVLSLSGAAMGINWMLLFEAYNYTSVAIATLCYYFAPVFIILLSPLLLRERVTTRKLACVGVAFAGMALVSGVLRSEGAGASEFRGVLLSLGAAALYACVVVLNKRLGAISDADRTIVQLTVSAVVLAPYVLLAGQAGLARCTSASIVLLLVLGVVHTGVAYVLYFGSLREIRVQTAAILSYVDPVVAVLLSALLLREPMTLLEILGAALVLGAAAASELPLRRRERG